MKFDTISEKDAPKKTGRQKYKVDEILKLIKDAQTNVGKGNVARISIMDFLTEYGNPSVKYKGYTVKKQLNDIATNNGLKIDVWTVGEYAYLRVK